MFLKIFIIVILVQKTECVWLFSCSSYSTEECNHTAGWVMKTRGLYVTAAAWDEVRSLLLPGFPKRFFNRERQICQFFCMKIKNFLFQIFTLCDGGKVMILELFRPEGGV